MTDDADRAIAARIVRRVAGDDADPVHEIVEALRGARREGKQTIARIVLDWLKRSDRTIAALVRKVKEST